MTTNLLLFAAFVAVMLLMSFNYTKKKKKIIFLGDSITEQGSQGIGFISKLKMYLQNEQLDSKYELVGSGRSGNKIYDLVLRLDRDVLAQNPDIVVIWIGTNDIWHKVLFGTGTDIDRFEAFYENLVQRLKSAKIEVVVCTPALLGEKTDFTNDLDPQLHQFTGVIRNVAATNDLRLVDLRKTFLTYNRENNPENKEAGILTNDGVHLNERGNALAAEEMWRILFDSRP